MHARIGLLLAGAFVASECVAAEHRGPSSAHSTRVIQSLWQPAPAQQALGLAAGAAPSPVPAVLTRPRDTMSLRALVAQLPAADAGIEVGGTGRILDTPVDVFLSAAIGSAVPQLQHGRITVGGQKTRWMIQAGEIASETQGQRGGLRFTFWHVRRHEVSATWFHSQTSGPAPFKAVNIRDEVQIGQTGRVIAEVSSNADALIRTRVALGRIAIESSSRRFTARHEQLASVSVGLIGGLALTGFVRLAGSAGTPLEDGRGVAVKFPIGGASGIGLETTRSLTPSSDTAMHAVFVTVPMKRLTLTTRMQQRAVDFLSMQSSGSRQDEVVATAALAATPWLSLNLQSVNSWQPGAVRGSQEMLTNVRLRNGLNLEASVPFQQFTPERVRFRLTRQLQNGLSLFVETGRFRPHTIRPAATPTESRVRILMSRTWNVSTPGRMALKLQPGA